MCFADEPGGAPRPAPGVAVDPIALEPVDEVRITTLVENTFDALLVGSERVARAGLGAGRVEAPQFLGGAADVGLVAEHGFSALVTVRRGATETALLFDAGLSPDALSLNAARLGVDLGAVQGIVLSHGHPDHAGGLLGLPRLPMVLHPGAWTRRRFALPGGARELASLSRRALEAEGFSLVERRVPSLLVDGAVLITGEVDRTTDFELGMPAAHEAWTGDGWEPDPWVVDDQALVVHVRDRGLVVLTGCGHAGAVNIVRHAQRLTGVAELHALVGGLHLGGAHVEPVIAPTVAALRALAPAVVVGGHCTGWKAQHALAAALPDAYLPPSAGSTYRL
ncbi:MBL fold metallo-hydrolase [Pseudonocardia sp. WMMC193]|uniref:MBL fold metallo-hydrolase n=1 Tax=Pseudonocardia sp. WMMC193 TaxID=2911965 RepID=UPI001F1BEEDD|nr:MBL fold metallo-hydrolase [Pseudonocardia sp. WMMC193]MCF7549669.1 MBL fold metallo-hydrolase [Pseudonocardia sp. WMMC193]